MAVLARVNWVAQQRVDLNHLLAQESFLAFDFRSLLTAFSGFDQPYILRGFEVVGKTGLTLSIRVAKSLVFNPLDGVGSFYAGGTDDDDILVDLPADQENIFVQAKFINETRAPVNTAFWDALALTGDDVAGTEFTASTNTQNVIVLVIESNTVGFSPDAIPITRATTSASAVTNMLNSHNNLYRLARGGATPNPLHKYPWSNTRGEPVVNGTGVGDDVDSPFRARDPSGARNDLALQSLKDWMDAVMTRIAELAGQTLWYDNSSSSQAIGNLTLNQLFFDTLGHSIEPDDNATIIWHRVAGSLRLGSQGTSPVAWKSNYSELTWTLGGTFVSDVPGGSRQYSDVHFESLEPATGGNIYLLLEREVSKGSGNAVSWADNSADTNLIEARTVSGVATDFTGIAVGDFIRKESEGYLRYYRILRVSDGTTINSTTGYVSDNTIVAVEFDKDIVGTASSEPLRYFRASYSNDDIVIDTTIGVFNFQDLNYYWLGRRVGTLFMLKGFGTMREGEEVTVLNDKFVGDEGAAADLIFEHAYESSFDTGAAGYALKTGAGTLLTIHRRKRDNLVESPGAGDNSDAYLTYTIASPVGLLAPGEALWVKLNDAAGGALTAGSVAGNASDDLNNANSITNVYEILPASETPLRNYDNRNVYLVARCLLTTGPEDTEVLEFSDGTVLASEGTFINNRFFTSGVTRFYNDDVHLMTRPAQSVLFIDQNVVGRINDDAANFFYDKDNGILGVFNWRFGLNYMDLAAPADVRVLGNLGTNTAIFGQSTSTIYIPGDLIVDGSVVATQTSQLQIDDKLVTLGIGTLLGQGGGSGIEVADNTLQVVSAQSAVGQVYIDLTYGAPHGYTTGLKVGVSSNVDVGGITAGLMSSDYVVVLVGATIGDAEVISATVLRIWTGTAAASTQNVVMAPPTTQIRTYDAESWIKMTDADGTTGDMTSWGFQVKGVAQVVTLTPVASYGTVPTAFSANMAQGRLPYVDNDGDGPAGSDSTLNFSADLTFDPFSSILRLDGTMTFVPQTVPVTVAPGDVYYSDARRKLVYRDSQGVRDIDGGDITGEYTGFASRDQTTFSFNDGTRELTLTPTGLAPDYFVQGIRSRLLAPVVSSVIPDTTGMHYFFIDEAGALTSTMTPNTQDYKEGAQVAAVFWEAGGTSQMLTDERHALTMDSDTHFYLHQTRGAQYGSGLSLLPNSFLGSDGSANGMGQVRMTGGTYYDEDLLNTVVASATPAAFFEQVLEGIAELPVFYRDGSEGWLKEAATQYPMKLGAARPQFNQLQPGPSNSVTHAGALTLTLPILDTLTGRGQTFTTPATDIKVFSIDINVNGNGSVEAGNVFLRVYTTAGGDPVTLLATSDLVPITSLPGDINTPVNFSFSSDILLQAGTEYAFVLFVDTNYTSPPNVEVSYESPGTYVGGQRTNTTDGGSSWFPSATQDMREWSVNYFEVDSWATIDTTADGKYIAQFVYVTNDVANPIIVVEGQAEYSTLEDAEGHATPESLDLTGLPYEDMKLLWRLIYRTDSTYANTPKAAIFAYADYRRTDDRRTIKQVVAASQIAATGSVHVGEELRTFDRNAGIDFVSEYYLSNIVLSGSSVNQQLFDFVYDWRFVSSLQIDYTVTEALTGFIRQGTLRIVSDGANTSITDEFCETGIMSLTWAVTNVGNEVIPDYTTALANAMTMKCHIKEFRA